MLSSIFPAIRENREGKGEKAYIRRYTSSIVVSIPIKCTYSVKLLDTHDLMQEWGADTREKV